MVIVLCNSMRHAGHVDPAVEPEVDSFAAAAAAASIAPVVDPAVIIALCHQGRALLTVHC